MQFKWDDFVTVTFPLPEVETSGKMSGKTSGKMSGKTSGKIIEHINANSHITIPELAEMIGVTERTIQRNLQKLQKEGKVKRIGPAKGGYWKVLKPKQ